jgi:hypothetical protein
MSPLVPRPYTRTYLFSDWHAALHSGLITMDSPPTWVYRHILPGVEYFVASISKGLTSLGSSYRRGLYLDP